jgi:hypothetical protein
MSAIGNLIGSITGTTQAANAAQSAATTEANAANYAANLQNQQFQTTQANLAPYMNVGTQALPQYLNLLGLGSQGTAGIQSALSNMPGYQFSLQQGLKAAANSAAGSGLNLSGAQQKGLSNFATGLAQNNYNTYLSNLQSAVGTGANAAAGLSSAGMTTAQNVGNLATSGASATAAGQVAAGNAQSNLINSLLQTGLGAAGIYSLASRAGGGTAGGGGGIFGNLFGGTSGGQLPATNMAGFNPGSDIMSAYAPSYAATQLPAIDFSAFDAASAPDMMAAFLSL